MEWLRGFLGSNRRQYVTAAVLVLFIILFQIQTGGLFLSPQNVNNFILQNGAMLIITLGMSLCFSTGNIDLSVGAVAVLAATLASLLTIELKLPFVLALILSLGVGALVGAWQGYLIAFVRMPSIVVTLIGMLVFRYLAIFLLKGQALSPLPEAYMWMGAGYITDLFGADRMHMTALIIGGILSVGYMFVELIKRGNNPDNNHEKFPAFFFSTRFVVGVGLIIFLSYWLTCYKGMPTVLFLLILLVLVYSHVNNKIRTSRYVQTSEENEEDTKLLAAKSKHLIFWVYVNMGVLAALAGILFAGRLGTVTPSLGANAEINGITACYIGGASLFKGIGTLSGSLLGGLILGVFDNGLPLLWISAALQRAIKGPVLLIAVAFDVYTRNKSKK